MSAAAAAAEARSSTRQWFDDVAVGQSIPVLRVTVDPVQMFFFSAATYNGHRIHYDHRWATEVEGHPDIVVQGPLQAALLARALTDWMGPTGRLVRFAVQNRASALSGRAAALQRRGDGRARPRRGRAGRAGPARVQVRHERR